MSEEEVLEGLQSANAYSTVSLDAPPKVMAPLSSTNETPAAYLWPMVDWLSH